tara:strand:+ start:4106 stop:4327 length:222 start_codon:yes stop_codon:yes gene_type:complete
MFYNSRRKHGETNNMPPLAHEKLEEFKQKICLVKFGRFKLWTSTARPLSLKKLWLDKKIKACKLCDEKLFKKA